MAKPSTCHLLLTLAQKLRYFEFYEKIMLNKMVTSLIIDVVSLLFGLFWMFFINSTLELWIKEIRIGCSQSIHHQEKDLSSKFSAVYIRWHLSLKVICRIEILSRRRKNFRELLFCSIFITRITFTTPNLEVATQWKQLTEDYVMYVAWILFCKWTISYLVFSY